MPGHRVLACALGAERLADKKPQRGQWRVDAFTIRTDFVIHDCTHRIGWQQFIKRARGPIGKTVLEAHERLPQAFFCYLHTWLILLVLMVTLDITILTTRGSQPSTFPRSLSTLWLKVVP